jgi:hypothetical protein
MPEDKGKSVKAPKSKSNDDFAPQLVKSKSEIPKNAVLKIDSDGGEYWEVETKHEETKKKMYPPSSGKKRTGTPRKKDPEKSSTFGSTIQRYKLPPPEVIPPKQTGLYGGISTYEKIDPAAQWGADYGITTFTFPDEYGRYTNTSRTTNIDKEGNEIAYDLANPLNSFKDGKFTPTLTGRTIDDVRNEWSLVGMSKPTDYSGNKANPDYKGSLMMPGTKATRVAGGGGGEFNQRNIANVPNALDKVPIGYIEQKYDTQGNPIVTPNVGVQMDTKNITPLRKGEMEVGRMYNIENPIEIKGKFAKGGIVSKIKGYYDGGPVYNPNMNIDGTYGDSNSSYKPIDTFGSGVVGMNDQYTAQNNMQAKKAIDENKKKANQQKARNVANGIGEGMGGIGSAYYNSQPAQNEGESARNAGLAAASQMGPIGGMIGGIAAIGDKIGKPIRNRSEKVDASGELLDEGKAKRNAAIGITFSPSKRLTYEGGLTDVTGQKYIDSIENKTKSQLAEVNAANTASKQQQAILARNNQEENPTLTNPYDLTGATFDKNQNMILADGQQFDKNRPMMNKGGIVGKIKNMYADGGEIKGKGTAKSDSIMAEVKEGSFVVPAENAELAKGIRKLYLKAPNKKANLKQEEGEAVKLSNGEHLFTPEENEYLESIGIELEDLAPNSEENNEEMIMGGMLKRADGGLVEGEGDPLIPYSKSIVPLVNKKDSAAFQTGYMEANPRNTIVDKYGNVAYPSGLLKSGSEMMKEVSESNKKFALEMNSPEKAGMYAAYLANQEKYKKGVSAGMNLTNQDVIDIAKDKIEGYSFPIDRLSPVDQKRIQKAMVDLGTSKKADGGKIMAPKIKKYAAGGDVVDGEPEIKTSKIEGRRNSTGNKDFDTQIDELSKKEYSKVEDVKSDIDKLQSLQEKYSSLYGKNSEEIALTIQKLHKTVPVVEKNESNYKRDSEINKNIELDKKELKEMGASDAQIKEYETEATTGNNKYFDKYRNEAKKKIAGELSYSNAGKSKALDEDLLKKDAKNFYAKRLIESINNVEIAKLKPQNFTREQIDNFNKDVELYKRKSLDVDDAIKNGGMKLVRERDVYRDLSKTKPSSSANTSDAIISETKNKSDVVTPKTNLETAPKLKQSDKTYEELIKKPVSYVGTPEAWKKAVDDSIAKGDTIPKGGVPTTKPSLKAPKVTTSKVTVDNLPTKDLSLQGLKQDAELKVANQAAMQEASIANAPTRQAVINDANVTSNENYLAAKPKSKNAWADKLSNIDPTAFVGIGQAALGLNMLGKEKRPIDKAVIDPTYNAAVNRAQQDALFGLTPEQRFMAEQDIQGGLNDAKFAGLNSSASGSFNLNRAAINDAWRNKLGLKQADAEMRMNKQKYADVMAGDRASILAGNRRQAFKDSMDAFQQKQQAGSELIGAGLANTIGAYRFRQDQQARLKADEARGYSLNNYNPTT